MGWVRCDGVSLTDIVDELVSMGWVGVRFGARRWAF